MTGTTRPAVPGAEAGGRSVPGDLAAGLTAAQAAARLARDRPNELPKRRQRRCGG